METDFCQCLYFTANRLARLMNKMAEEEFAPIGLSPTYVFLIMVVTEHPGINQKDLCEKLHIAPSTSTRFVDKLITKGLIEKKQDGKQIMIYPTEKANEMIPEIKQCWKKLYDRYSAILGEEVGKDLTEKIHWVSGQLEL